ncbi:MAG: CDP-diacylglycerol--glycerol-3-phosphate 3-phosphatidyltransferase [Bdellovibrionaceae bacterium]|nr:CDP-diacylglycerol--glycerol-3-phosphate 3-phosphatidyltransferase [Pseudobdellovibrionaceae bacterium]
MNLPNQLTLGRLVLCGVFTLLLALETSWSGLAALVVFVVASLTDWLDGHLARKWNLITDLGKLLDPLADKILISAAFIGMVAAGLAPFWIVVCIIAREFLITGLRTLAASKGIVLAAERLGKHKTISQMVTAHVGLIHLALGGMGWWPQLSEWMNAWILPPLLYLTLLITLYSGASYFIKNKRLLF